MEKETVETNIEETAVVPQEDTTSKNIEEKVSELSSYTQELEAKLAKATEERENYKKAAIKYKKASKDDFFDDEDDIDSTSVSLNADELREIARQEAQAIFREEIAQKQAKETKSKQLIDELSLALKNRTQPISVSGGSNQDKPKSETSPWSKDQIDALKAKGLDPEKVWKTLQQM